MAGPTYRSEGREVCKELVNLTRYSHFTRLLLSVREWAKTAIRFPSACVLREKQNCKCGAGDTRFPAAAVLPNSGLCARQGVIVLAEICLQTATTHTS